MSAQFEVAGLSALKDQLDQFPEKVERNALRGAMRAGARVIANEVKARVPVQTGQLQKSIRVTGGIKNGFIYATVKAGGQVRGGAKNGKKQRGAFYAHMVEFGTAAHLIRAAVQKALTIGGALAKVVHHPGSQPHPFFRPAISTKSQAAAEAVRDYLANRLEKLNEPDNES